MEVQTRLKHGHIEFCNVAQFEEKLKALQEQAAQDLKKVRELFSVLDDITKTT